jgi:hypothetical protein
MSKKVHAISSGYTLACNRKVQWLWALTSNNLSKVTCKKCLKVPVYKLCIMTRKF